LQDQLRKREGDIEIMRRQLSDINEREATRMEDMEREAEYFKNILKQY
jgi:hypothetical protein